ncbi:alpha/beta hydrolase [Salinibacterium sp. UTAS2018]|uniref:alpha/beta hydrolase n=1 Tax=Salinibacterium sp. UTAS2018 TaxID=2508880 RepID=UPI00100945B9|nr:alpha/beta hydrolase [Salinibacterium sp. UTAS2018]QAV69024.1 alpha/beta hydrolase [Salinibacterium sp. UTAS2018]
MSTRKIHPAPPFDTELAAVLAIVNEQLPPTVTPEMIEPLRAGFVTAVDELLLDRPVSHREETFAGPGGDLIVSIFQRTDHTTAGLGILHTHGGGMIIGDRFMGMETMLAWVEELDAVAVSVEYRLAPEHPDPAPVDDCYASLVWTAENAERLGIDPAKLIISGGSAGGGLAAGTTLMARDRGGPALAAQLLIYPMLDDRNQTVSSHQIDGTGVWDRGSNDTGWDALLGDRRKTDQVSIYAAPARATDLSNLPPTFIDVGTSEVFRDEDVAYASAIWASGGHCELHVWPGGFHGYDFMAPLAALSVATQDARLNWLRRTLGL